MNERAGVSSQHRACSDHPSPGHAPWYVVPAGARLIVSQIILDTLEKLDMTYSEPSPGRRQELLSIREGLAKVIF